MRSNLVFLDIKNLSLKCLIFSIKVIFEVKSYFEHVQLHFNKTLIVNFFLYFLKNTVTSIIINLVIKCEISNSEKKISVRTWSVENDENSDYHLPLADKLPRSQEVLG